MGAESAIRAGVATSPWLVETQAHPIDQRLTIAGPRCSQMTMVRRGTTDREVAGGLVHQFPTCLIRELDLVRTTLNGLARDPLIAVGTFSRRGCKGGITRWTAKQALLMSNNQDNGDPGIEQQPRFNMTLSVSLDNGKTWPHRAIVWPAHLGKTGYSDVRVTSSGKYVVAQQLLLRRHSQLTCTIAIDYLGYRAGGSTLRHSTSFTLPRCCAETVCKYDG